MAIEQDSGLFTVAAIRRRRDGTTRYLFHERERIFALSASAGEEKETATALEEARKRKRPLSVTVDPKQSVILRVEEPTNDALEEFARTRILLDRPSRIAAIDVRKIDPTKFNLVDIYLKWPPFKLCEKVIPSYAKAKQIFDFCAQLSCNLPGPYAVTPCIPFQYVIDGCYARAHQMRRIITTRFRYCCEKVFSFATANDDTLAVRAEKWGGCCVEWWYHVAPLVRVRLEIKGFPRRFSLTLAMVIDPGMFDKPVLLSTWLAAQENTGCNPHAHVTSYSIQPGSAYTPSFGGGFTTDPAYTQTEATLIDYSGLTTC
jgi:hypothetical protein